MTTYTYLELKHMTQDQHSRHHENIPAYSIGALDTDEAAEFESHLETCDSCRTELAEYRALGTSLLTATPPKQPSTALRKRLQSQLPGKRGSDRPRFSISFSRLAWGLAVIALLVMNLASFVQLRQIRNQQAALADQFANAQAALAILSSPDVMMLPISGETVTGTLLLDRERNQAVLVARDLPELSESQIYQIWLVRPEGGRDSAGLFRPEIGQSYTTQTIQISQPLSSYMGIGVTVEPANGSDAPTGERVFKVDF
jgi:anti-sigma-K factor RskA